ncbi:MAG: hypothetical protein ABIO80_02420 [Sphingomicrobium sp.]
MATSAAAVMARARRRIAEHFTSADAVSADQAVTFTPKRLIAERQFARMQAAGVIRSTADGRYWMDLPTYRSWQGKRRWRVAAAALVAAVAVAILA